MKAHSKAGYGSGWHKQSARHSSARKTGRAGGLYQSQLRKGTKEKLIGGLGDYKNDLLFDKKQLLKGMKVESEHTKDKQIQKEISKDHLSENPAYYKELETLENKPKNPISKDTLDLPVQFSITVPSTQGADKKLSNSDFKKRVQEVKKWIVDRYYGDTSTLSKGDYTDKGKLIEEDVAVINVSTSPEDYKKNMNQLGEYIKSLRNKYEQRQMAYSVEGDLFLYPEDADKTPVQK